MAKDGSSAFEWFMSDGKTGLEWGEIDEVQEPWMPIDENLEVFERINNYLDKEIQSVNIRDALKNISVDVDNTGIFKNVAEKNKIDSTAMALSDAGNQKTTAEQLSEMAKNISDYNEALDDAKKKKRKRQMRKAAQDWNDTHPDDQIKYDAWITELDTWFDMGESELYSELRKRNALPFDASISYDRPANTKFENSRYARGV